MAGEAALSDVGSCPAIRYVIDVGIIHGGVGVRCVSIRDVLGYPGLGLLSALTNAFTQHPEFYLINLWGEVAEEVSSS